MSKRWPGLLLLVVLFGSGRAARAMITASPPTQEFGTVAVGASNTKSVMVSNDAMVSATISLGGDCTYFSITSSTTVSLSLTPIAASFKFMPLLGGDQTCTVNVTNNADSMSLGTFTLHATGSGTPMITVTPGPLDFAGVGIGETSDTMHVTATNNGTDTLVISSASVAVNGSNYTVSGTTGMQNVAPGQHADWDIACKPTAMGNEDGVFRVSSNAGPDNDVALKCTGQIGALTTSNVNLDFNAVALNDAKTLNITLTNTGNLPVTGITASLDNTAVGYAIVAATVPDLLTASGTATDHATVMVKFAPTAPTDGVTSHIVFKGTWTGKAAHMTTAPTVTLNGKTIALSVSTPTIDFSDFRFDSKPTQPFNIVNSGTSDVLIAAVDFAPDAGTAKAELGIKITLDGADADLGQPLPAGHHFVVTLTAQPNNRAGAFGGKVAVKSTGINDIVVTVKGTSTAAVIQLTDASFGAVDIQAASPKLTAAIKNMTADGATLDVSAITVMTTQGTDTAFHFTQALPTGVTHLAQGQSIPIEVTYAPTVQRAVGDADKLVLVATLTGALNGPSQMTITLSGRGIDRDLALPTTPMFPTTFRNPGDTPPVAVTIQNTGEATMNVSAIMIAGGPVWQLVDNADARIAGGTSYDFMVKFTPDAIGAAPQGQLMFTTDDSAHRTAIVLLDGTGAARRVSFGPTAEVEPRTIDLGVTGVNIPIVLDDALVVTSMDPTATFKIHQIQLADGMFKLGDAPADDALAPMATRSYAVTFSPTQIGHFEAMATLYLDQDPIEQSHVLLVGDAVFVEAHGGGGCDVGGGGGLVIGLGALAAMRRRRRAAEAS